MDAARSAALRESRAAARSHRRRRSGHPLAERLAHLAGRLGVWGLGLAPERFALALTRGLARLAVLVDARHRRLALRNLDLAYGDELSPAQKGAIVRGCYRNLFQNAVEFVHAVRRARRGEPPADIEIEGAHHIEAVAKSGRGALFVSCHMGNWELCPVWPHRLGAPLHSIATPRRNAHLDQTLNEMREALGQTVVWKHGAFREAVRLLREGRCVGVLADQNQRRGAVFVDFFGVRASTTRGPAMLARRADVPILPAAIRRLPGTNRHRLTVTAPIEPIRSDAADDDVQRLTQAYTARLEALIREAPDQWLWHHRRWRSRPWREIRLARDAARIVRGCAASAHAHGPSLEPPAQPWEDTPTAIRAGLPARGPVERREASIRASPRLRAQLERLPRR